jgi:predicted ATPase
MVYMRQQSASSCLAENMRRAVCAGQEGNVKKRNRVESRERDAAEAGTLSLEEVVAVTQLARITVRGFKSIQKLEDFKLERLNVLIGANGAGKSNFISFFRMLAEMMEGRLQFYVKGEYGPDALLFGGRKRTRQIEADLYFAGNEYRFSLAPAASQLIFASEDAYFKGNDSRTWWRSLGSGHTETKLPSAGGDRIARSVIPAVQSWRVFHFHDTSSLAPVRTAQPVRDNLKLKPDAANLAPFLRMLREKHPKYYASIVETVRMVAPFFKDFLHRDEPGERMELEWLEEEDPDTPRGPLQLSDGTLRFICLATLLLQPPLLQPDTILVDEPELGLHPYALVILSSLLRRASEGKQLIVSTQSVELINQLDPADVIVTERRDGASVFQRLDSERLSEWLEDYSLGELWKMNVVGGRPSR